MKNKTTLIAFILIASLISAPQAFPAGKSAIVIKKAGRSSTSIPNTILSGNGAPSKTIGIDGDFYIDIKNAFLYGPKTKSIWKIATSLRIVDSRELAVPASGSDGAKGNTGEQGLTGATGSNGNTGATGAKGADGAIGATGLPGANGAAGLPGAVGPAGSVGATGATGSMGASGSAGANGSAGAAGINGSAGAAGINGVDGTKGDTGATGPAGPTGSVGAKGADGTNGTVGLKGDTGSTGATGNAGTNGSNGAAGISNAYWVTVPTLRLSSSGSMQITSWANFGSAIDAGSYTFQIILDGTFSTTNTSVLNVGIEIAAGDASTFFHSQVMESDSDSFVGGLGGRHIQFMVFGTITSVSTTTLLKIRAVDLLGNTAPGTLSIDGSALISKVGSIG
ncbi:MAG: hypothetical protein WCJ89_02240 [Actinomycetes bacterium]